MSWQHYLYSKLGKKEEQMIEETNEKASVDKKGEEKKIEDTVERIVAMAKVLFGLHMVRMSDESQKVKLYHNSMKKSKFFRISLLSLNIILILS